MNSSMPPRAVIARLTSSSGSPARVTTTSGGSCGVLVGEGTTSVEDGRVSVGDGDVAVGSSVGGVGMSVVAGSVGSAAPQASMRAPTARTPTPAAVVFKKSRRESLDIFLLLLETGELYRMSGGVSAFLVVFFISAGFPFSAPTVFFTAVLAT